MAYRLFTRLKRLLKSRDLFNNWLTLGLKYMLYKKILTSKSTRSLIASCRDGGSVELSLEQYFSIVSLYTAGLLKSLDCVSGDVSVCGIDLAIDELDREFYWLVSSHRACRALLDGIVSGRVKRKSDVWIVDGVRFKKLRPGVVEVFLMNHWPLYEIDLRGREVLDIGAYVGDTSLYFLMNEARRVIAVEPHPIAFKEMVENIKLNNASEKIMAINAAIGSSRGSTKIPVDVPLSEVIGMSALKNFKEQGQDGHYAEVSVATLEDVASYLEDPYMVKIECEGCEYEILRSNIDTLKKFETILLEYHRGYDVIEKWLKDTHTCKHHTYEFSEPGVGVIICLKYS